MTLPHLPILRYGEAYRSLDVSAIFDPRTAAPIAEVSVANAGLIRRDAARAIDARDAARSVTCRRMLEICRRAGELFMNADLPMGEETHSPARYVQVLSTTSGLPHSLCRQNMRKIHTVLTTMPTILSGLMRGLNPDIIDSGEGEQAGAPVSFFPTTDAMGVVLPSNSPGVNSIWLPAVAMKTPVIVKPGREEPWTPFRIMQALLAAGCPRSLLGFYPTDHTGADTIMRSCGRAIIFGDDRTLKRYADDPGIQLHGTGRSKVLIAEDMIERWRDHLDVLIASVADNGGRSCINASTIVVPRYADDIAMAIAQGLAKIQPQAMDDDNASLSAFANPAMAEWINGRIDEGLAHPGAVDVTARLRGSARLTLRDGWIYLLPTVVRCDSIAHPLGNTEFLFPFASVVELPQSQWPDALGASLVVTVITRDQTLIDRLMRSSLIDRLNIGAMPTSRVNWDQPHEGNLFEFLHRRRAIQRAKV